MFFRCPAIAICAGGGRQWQSIKPGKKIIKKVVYLVGVQQAANLILFKNLNINIILCTAREGCAGGT